MKWPTTIIKCKPGETRGRLHGYEITQVWPDRREVFAVIAKTGIEAVNSARQMGMLRTIHSLSQVAA